MGLVIGICRFFDFWGVFCLIVIWKFIVKFLDYLVNCEVYDYLIFIVVIGLKNLVNDIDSFEISLDN